MSLVHPAELWLGDTALLIERATTLFIEKWCKYGACRRCITCTQIAQQKYYKVRFLVPDKQSYTVDAIDQIKYLTSFALDSDDQFYIVITQTELLSPAAANRLLKVLEEPTTGYHFLLFAPTKQLVLNTLVSRCVIHDYRVEQGEKSDKELFAMLTNLEQLEKYITSGNRDLEVLSEQESRKLLDELFCFWTDFYQKALLRNDGILMRRAQRMLLIIRRALEYPPMPGSAKLLWRTVLMLAHQVISECG